MTLRSLFIFAAVVPALVVLWIVARFFDQAMQQALDEELGRRLCVVAAAASVVVDSRVFMLEPGDEDSRVARNMRRRLAELARVTEIESLKILDLSGERATVMLDSQETSRVHEDYVRGPFDRAELADVRAARTAASVLFTDENGRWYKSGYAPIIETSTRSGSVVRGAIVAHAPAPLFDVIGELRTTVAIIAISGCVGLVLLSLFASHSITRSLHALSRAAVRIGAGDRGTHLPKGGPKEVRILSSTMQTMARSVTEREEELQTMLSGIAHEVRNPLGGIELFGGLLREELANDPRQEHVDRVMKEIGHLGKVVNDFLDYGRKAPLSTKPIAARALVLEVAAIARADLQTKAIALEVNAPDDLIVDIDEEKMRRVFLNLVKNAIDAAPQNSAVRIEASRVDEKTWEIRVVDHGPGIDLQHRGEIFRPFFTTKQKGAGLGLALAQKTVEAHKGSIAVEDTPGGGATFVVRLPI